MMKNRFVLFCLSGAVALSVTGCSGLMARSDDSQCARDLAAVERTAGEARSELARGLDAEARQATLDHMVDAAGDARASCGYEKPRTRGSDRARQPKAG